MLWIQYPAQGFYYNHKNQHAPHIQSQTTHGLYLSRSSVENQVFLKKIIKKARKHNIDTFVVDLGDISDRYLSSLDLCTQAGISLVLRVVVFPGGGTHEQVTDPQYWQQYWPAIKTVIDHTSIKAVQLDYIRYHTKHTPHPDNALHIQKIIAWYNNLLDAYDIRLQIAAFGITLFNPSHAIGQNIEVFHGSYDTLCPMVYPSHFSSISHSYTPFSTLFEPLSRTQLLKSGQQNFKVVPYIETYNYRRRMSNHERINYIKEQITASYHSGADGWIAWSANNYYKHLFHALDELKQENHPITR